MENRPVILTTATAELAEYKDRYAPLDFVSVSDSIMEMMTKTPANPRCVIGYSRLRKMAKTPTTLNKEDVPRKLEA